MEIKRTKLTIIIELLLIYICVLLINYSIDNIILCILIPIIVILISFGIGFYEGILKCNE